jgi:16S rRNA (uracil1498-N3)-methyltransferase
MAHFYLTEELSLRAGESVELTGPEARHAVVVSRLGVGDRIRLGDGAGRIADGVVRVAESARLVVDVDSVTETPRRSPQFALVQALAKGDRDELAVQAATELGVDVVIPWQAARSIVRWEGPKRQKGRERWAAVVREATKQSMRAWLPDVLEVVDLRGLCALGAEAQLLVLDPTAGESIADVRADGRDLVVVVGPEGGIAPAELAALAEAGARFVRLGPEVLRTSTAGPAALAVLSVAEGRWDAPSGRG